ncbi:Crp/Fnr family transcriptional regulator [Pleurocapsales cyanobacterium LEGE 10410]|nr:Crp/Fnr family transcriptional regulator [Pleurocapsales cyanobacterium LEGE 10410]
MSPERLPSANRLLLALSDTEYQRLEPYVASVDLPLGMVLYEALEEIDTIYFPCDGLISLVSTLENGATTEIGLIGATGMVGLPVILGSGRSNHRAIVQVAGNVTKISAVILKQEFDRGGELQKILHRYIETRLNEVAQLAVCNCHHTIEERLARWLLTVQDLIQSDELPLTQEFIGNMLGVRRSSVTVSAGILQQAGLIRYSRGKITVLDRSNLEQTACECYELLRKHIGRV